MDPALTARLRSLADSAPPRPPRPGGEEPGFYDALEDQAKRIRETRPKWSLRAAVDYLLDGLGWQAPGKTEEERERARHAIHRAMRYRINGGRRKRKEGKV